MLKIQVCLIVIALLFGGCSSSSEKANRNNDLSRENSVYEVPELIMLSKLKDKGSVEYEIASSKAAYTSLRLAKTFRESKKIKSSIRLLHSAVFLMPWRDDVASSYKKSIRQYEKMIKVKSSKKENSCSELSDDLKFIQMYAPDLLKDKAVRSCKFVSSNKKFTFSDYLRESSRLAPEIAEEKISSNNLMAEYEEELFYNSFKPLDDFIRISLLRTHALFGNDGLNCNRFSLIAGSLQASTVSVKGKCKSKFSKNIKLFKKGGIYLKDLIHWKRGPVLYPFLDLGSSSFVNQAYAEQGRWKNLLSEDHIKGARLWGTDIYTTSPKIKTMIKELHVVARGAVAVELPLSVFVNGKHRQNIYCKYDSRSLIEGDSVREHNWPNRFKYWESRYKFSCDENSIRLPYIILPDREDMNYELILNNLSKEEVSNLKSIDVRVNYELLLKMIYSRNNLKFQKRY